MTNTIQTYTGLLVDPFNMTADDIDIVDVAHSLSQTCRYNGHTNPFYSVAEHCVRMSEFFDDPMLQKWALLHDISEPYLGDVPKPLKYAFPGIEAAEDAIMAIAAAKFKLDGTVIPDIVKQADKHIVWDEAMSVMRSYQDHMSTRWLSNRHPSGQMLGETIQPWDCARAKMEFLERFAFLFKIY